MFSQTAEYALRAVVWLASHPLSGPVGSQKISEGTQVPKTYLSKILQSLVKAGIVTSRRGAGGGFELRRGPSELTVLEVVNSVDTFRRIKGCPLHLKTHKNTLCPMHFQLDEALRTVEETLGRTLIADVLRAPSRPLPMVETETES